MPRLSKFFYNLTTDWLNRVLLFFIILFVALGTILYIKSGDRSEASLVEQTLHREQVIARSGAKSIESFIKLAGNSMTVLARSPRVLSFGDQTQEALNDFINDWDGTPAMGIILTDKEGIVLFNANNRGDEPQTGVSVADRDYFLWAKEAKSGEIYVGQSILSRLGTTRGQFIIPLTTPVFEDGEFKGILTVAILLSELTKTYLEPLKISANSRVYLVNQDGLLIYSGIPELTGVSFFEYIEENPFPGSDLLLARLKKEFAQAVAKGEGKLDYIRNDYYQKTKLQRWLLAYSVINLGQDRYWILSVETPVEDALAFFAPFYGNQIIALLFGLLAILFFSGLLVLAVRVAQRDSYLDGFAEGRDHDSRNKGVGIRNEASSP